jgi:hypothetical protein
LWQRRTEEVLRKKLAVLVAMAMMLAMMLTSAGMASAAPCGGSCGGKPSGGPNVFALDNAAAPGLEALKNVIERRGLR